MSTAEARSGGEDPSVVPALLAELRRLAASLGAARLDELDASDAARAHDELRRACDQLRAVDARLLAHVESDGRWAASGGRPGSGGPGAG